MTLFKKNFSYKRGWQFANKLKLFTLFFVMLTSLIAGATSVLAQGVNSDGWDYYPDFNSGIVAKLDYEGEVACASTNGQDCLWGKLKSEIKFKDLKPLKCGSMHASIYNNDRGYGSRGHWCEILKTIRDKGQGKPDKPDVSSGKPKPPVDSGKPENKLKPKPEGKPDKPDVSSGKPKPPVDSGKPENKLKPKPEGKPDKPDVSGEKPKPPVDPGTPDKPDVSGGKPKLLETPSLALGTGPELTVKPDQLNWFSGAKVKGLQGLVLTPDYQGQVACASTDGIYCLRNVAMKEINFATLRPVKCLVEDYYNNPQHWCAKVKKHEVFLSLQNRDYYARPDIDGSKYVKGYQPVVQGEPGSVLALSGSFMDLPSDSLSYEYADLEAKKVNKNKLAIPASCNPSWVNYASSSVSEVVNNIEATSDICAQEFFKTAKLQSSVATDLFKPEVVQGAVDRLTSYLTPWDGVVKNKEIYNLTVFLRAYKYVKFYNYTYVAKISDALETQIAALFSRGLTYGNGFFGMDAKLEKIRTNSLQSSMLYELIMAQGNYDSWSSDGIDYITKVIRDFNPATFNNLSVKERTAVARIISSIFAALYYDTNIQRKINNDPRFRTAYVELVAELVKFSLDKEVVSYPNLALNAGREALRYPLTSSKRSDFNISYRKYKSSTSLTNRPELYAIFVKAVNDAKVCRDFGVCSARSELVRTVFLTTYKCPTASVEFHYGAASTQGEMKQLCKYFTETSKSFNTRFSVVPIESNDVKGHTLKMYVYNNASDWRLYGKALFDLGTSSPGAFVGNYKKSKAPEAHILRRGNDLNFDKVPFWNAVHEYVHFFVGKYLRKGGRAELTMAQLKALTWFEEGMAEYGHLELYLGRTSAYNLGYLPWLQRVKAEGLSLSDIISGKSDHIYSGSYAVVKYLLEEQVGTPAVISIYLKAGMYDAYNALCKASYVFNNDFNLWLQDKVK